MHMAGQETHRGSARWRNGRYELKRCPLAARVHTMSRTVAKELVETLNLAGVQRIYGRIGDSPSASFELMGEAVDFGREVPDPVSVWIATL